MLDKNGNKLVTKYGLTGKGGVPYSVDFETQTISYGKPGAEQTVQFEFRERLAKDNERGSSIRIIADGDGPLDDLVNKLVELGLVLYHRKEEFETRFYWFYRYCYGAYYWETKWAHEVLWEMLGRDC